MIVIPTYRVSSLAAFARWKQQEDADVSWLHRHITIELDTEATNRGKAFHKALETAQEGEYTTVTADGYTFAFTCEAEITLPKTRELRQAKDYAGIIITGQCDGIEGKRIIDHKTVQQFDAEYHLDGMQHRFYLDIFDADRFDWHIWEVGETKKSPKAYEVYAHHLLTQYRYPQLEDDCRELAMEFLDFTNRMGWNKERKC